VGKSGRTSAWNNVKGVRNNIAMELPEFSYVDARLIEVAQESAQ
jgi:hypothetical protein